MKKNNSTGIILGLLFLVIGAGYLAEVVGILEEFTIFFDGWWTLFIIVPCFCGLCTRGGGKVGYVIGIAVGLFLLLTAQDILDSDKLWALLLAVVCVLVGINLILPKKKTWRGEETQHAQTDRFDRGENVAAGDTHTEDAIYEEAKDVTVEPTEQYKENAGTGDKVVCQAVFSGRDIHVDNSYFYGANLSVLFGGIDLNLKNALITKNVTIEVKATFGGIDILMPSNVRVVVDVTPILGGVDNGTRTPLGADENTPTVYIKGTCIFGGVEVK